MKYNSRIYLAGHTGLIGSALFRVLKQKGYQQIITRSHSDLDLTNQAAVNTFFEKHRPEYVILAAGAVGGILHNISNPAHLLATNLLIQTNILQAANNTDIKRLVLFGSSCMYPRNCIQPMAESNIFSGKPEQTSLSYAVSKMAGVQLCIASNQQYDTPRFIPVIPNSVYGPNDNFNPKTGHVLSSLITKFYNAKANNSPSIKLWGTGVPRREFIHADDVAYATVTLLSLKTITLRLPINLGVEKDYSIRELSKIIAKIVGYQGEIDWDQEKPDGAPQKLLESSQIRSTGWRPTISIHDGISSTYQWYVQNYHLRGYTDV